MLSCWSERDLCMHVTPLPLTRPARVKCIEIWCRVYVASFFIILDCVFLSCVLWLVISGIYKVQDVTRLYYYFIYYLLINRPIHSLRPAIGFIKYELRKSIAASMAALIGKTKDFTGVLIPSSRKFVIGIRKEVLKCWQNTRKIIMGFRDEEAKLTRENFRPSRTNMESWKWK